MWNIKKITILLCFLSLVAFISCSAEDKTGSPKPEGETEITGETGGGSGTGGSGSGGSGESGSGSGGGTGESGGSGETGGGSETGGSGESGTGETDHPPAGKYWEPDQLLQTYAEVSTVDGKTKIKGRAQVNKGNRAGTESFDFEISKWKKTTKDGKTALEAENIKNCDKNKNTNAIIIYYSDTQTLNITFDWEDPSNGKNCEGNLELPKMSE